MSGTVNPATTSVVVEQLTLEVSDIFQEKADVPINITATPAGTLAVDLSASDKRYVLRALILKVADPGTETVFVEMSRLVNDIETVVDTFEIDAGNWTEYLDLIDMFGDMDVYGDLIKIRCRTSGGSTAVTGQYSYASATNG